MLSPDPHSPPPEARDLTIAISAMSDRLGGVTLPPPHPELRYLLLVQMARAGGQERLDPGLETRDDLRVVWLKGRGLSHSRNAALDLVQDRFILFSDDDITLCPAGIMTLLEALRADPALDLVAGWRAESLPGPDHPRAAPHRLTRFNSGRVCTPEFMLRASAARRLDVRFDPQFGVGAPLPTGEDYIFVADLLRAGARGRSLPVITGRHPHESTGDIWNDPALLRARRAVLTRVFGALAPVVALAYGYKHRRRFASRRAAWGFVCGL